MSKIIKKQRLPIALAMVVALALGGGAALQSARVSGDEQVKKPAVEAQSVEHAKGLSRAFRKATEMVNPAVVTIRSKTKAQPIKRVTPGGKGANPFKGTPWEDLFGDEFNVPNQPSPRREGMGSGVIIEKDGLILTNNHVVDGADEVVVQLTDGREFKAEEIKVDPHTDLAVLRIKGAGSLPYAQLGDSDAMEVGDWVLAIGNPFEQEHSVSAGIISGKGRELGGIRRAKFLQTDAAINPGNSGGPLINLEGEIIGINTAIATNTGAFNGIGFAVPSNLAKWVVDRLVHEGNVKRAYLGVKIGRIDQALGSQFHVAPDEGVLIVEVYPDTPAAEAKIESGDVVKSFDGTKIHNPGELQELVERTPLGSQHKVEVLRDGKATMLSITAKAMPEKFGLVANVDSPEGAATDASTYEAKDLGLAVTEASESNLKSLGFKGYSGVVISSVEPGGVAEEAGLRPGILIMKVGSTAVKNLEDFKTALTKNSLDQGILLQYRSAQGNNFAVLKR